jgi:hypothetical protein
MIDLKEFVTSLILVVAWEIAKGFFSTAGTEIYFFVYRRFVGLAGKRIAPERPTEFEFSFFVEEDGNTYPVFVNASQNDLKAMDMGLVSLDDLRSEVQTILDPSKVARVNARLSRFAPHLRSILCVPIRPTVE